MLGVLAGAQTCRAGLRLCPLWCDSSGNQATGAPQVGDSVHALDPSEEIAVFRPNLLGANLCLGPHHQPQAEVASNWEPAGSLAEGVCLLALAVSCLPSLTSRASQSATALSVFIQSCSDGGVWQRVLSPNLCVFPLSLSGAIELGAVLGQLPQAASGIQAGLI